MRCRATASDLTLSWPSIATAQQFVVHTIRFGPRLRAPRNFQGGFGECDYAVVPAATRSSSPWTSWDAMHNLRFLRL